MDIKFKHRILGIIVIIAFVVIFLPIFLEQREQSQRFEELAGDIPPKTKELVLTFREDEQTANIEESHNDNKPEDPIKPHPAAKNITSRPASVPVASTPKAVTPLKTTKSNVQPSAKESKSSAPASSAAPITTGWVIQLASFESKSNAQRLEQKLRKMGYSAFTVDANTSHGIIFRVYIGPEAQKQDADKIQASLHQKLHLNSFIKRYEKDAK